MTHVGVDHADLVVFVGAHPVGDDLQGVPRPSPTGWGSYKNHPLNIVQDFKEPDQSGDPLKA
jgi:hypothetical protein